MDVVAGVIITLLTLVANAVFDGTGSVVAINVAFLLFVILVLWLLPLLLMVLLFLVLFQLLILMLLLLFYCWCF